MVKMKFKDKITLKRRN